MSSRLELLLLAGTIFGMIFGAGAILEWSERDPVFINCSLEVC